MFNNISKNKENEYKSIFDKYDYNKDGIVNSSELANILKAIDIDASSQEIKEILEEIELEENGEIDFDSFINIINRREKYVDTEEEVLNAFKIFDKEGNGLININELKHIMLTVGKNLSEPEINDMLKEADIDGDGYINYEEFVRSLMTK